MKKNKDNYFILAILAIFCPLLSHASTEAKFSLNPATSVTLQVPKNRTATVQYTVRNNTKISRTLTVVPMTGITQDTTDSNNCANPFTLGALQSCTLTLLLNGSQLPPMTTRGPVVCKTKSASNNTPDPFLCSQPSTNDSLSITVTSAAKPESNVYVTNWDAKSISLCSTNESTGLLENCHITAIDGTLANPEALAINSSTTILYVANIAGTTVTLCQVDSSTGALSQCRATGSNFHGPDGVALNPAGTFAYVSNVTTDNVTMCAITSSTGELTNCVATGSNFNRPSDITLNAAGTFAYISNFDGNTVTICAIDSSNGLLSSCTVSAASFNSPEGITLAPLGNFAYITNNGNNTVSVCAVDNNTGALSSCALTSAIFTGFGNLAFNASGTLAYVPSSTTRVSTCFVNTISGQLSNCVDSSSVFVSPSGLLSVTLS